MFRITFSKVHVKRFQQELDKAYKRGDKRAVRHLSVLRGSLETADYQIAPQVCA